MTRLSAVVLFVALLYNPSPGLAIAIAPNLGSASNFAVLAGSAVTCTASMIAGAVGVVLGTGLTNTGCSIGAVHAGDTAAKTAYADFLSAYNELQNNTPCEGAPLTGTLANVTLSPGVYCFTAAATLTGTLTLDAAGNPNAVWIFKIGTAGTGALTATGFTVRMIRGGQPCNVYWWVAQAATLTTSSFQGTILTGADITTTGATFTGGALAGGAGSTLVPTGAVTSTGSAVFGCAGAGTIPPVGDKCEEHHDKDGHGHGGKGDGKCNQGVGNGPEGCDPGNSNHHNPSNDERGGTPGNPGRKLGNR